MQVSGRVTRVAGLVMECVGLKLAVGAACMIPVASGARIEAEVVGFEGDKLFLMPQSDVEGVVPGSRVFPVEASVPKPGTVPHPRRRPMDRARHLPVGWGLLGRVVDGAGRPLDGKGPVSTEHMGPLNARPINPLDRVPISETLDVGVRAINSLLTVGRGHRLGLFAGTGVGKSVLLGMIARYTTADVIVVGLIGERGREVKEFIEEILGEEGLRRAVVVAAPADTPPLMRLQGAAYATAIAEHFRDEGRNVLLIMDSLTRYAMAQREIALAIGEPPATKGYPPSVFAKLPVLVERAGNGQLGGGSITAFYTVLSEGDDQQDPIADAAQMAGITPFAYQNFVAFLGKLEQALDGQREVLKHARIKADMEKKGWQESERKRLSYRTLNERAAQQALTLESKRDQKMMDDHAARTARRAR
jgi:flagellum-specific ATP synthase